MRSLRVCRSLTLEARTRLDAGFLGALKTRLGSMLRGEWFFRHLKNWLPDEDLMGLQQFDLGGQHLLNKCLPPNKSCLDAGIDGHGHAPDFFFFEAPQKTLV